MARIILQPRQKTQQRRLWLATGLAVAAAASLFLLQLDLSPTTLSPERQQQVFLEPMPVRWSGTSSDNAYRQQRMAWEQRLLQLRQSKTRHHPDLEAAEVLIPTLLQAEDVSRRIDRIGDGDPALRQQLGERLAQLNDHIRRTQAAQH